MSAIYNAISKGVKVINLSFGGGYNSSLSDALDYAYNNSVTVVCSSGNNSSSSISFPASHQYTIATGGINQLYQRVGDSNYGSGLDLVAPGTIIWSTCKSSEGYYRYASGTSFAAPQVAGVAALMLSVNPYLTPSQIKSTLQNTCTKLSGYTYTNGWNEQIGYGLLNAATAVIAVMNLKIVGPTLVSTNGTYSIENLPSGVTVEWSLSNSYYNQNCLQQNYPSTNQCRITRSSSQNMMNATLTANIKYNGVTIQTLTKTGVYAYADFYGQYTSGNLSGNIDYTHLFYVKPNNNTYITSPNFYGATVTYDYTGTIPNNWGFSSQNGYLQFIMPSNNNGTPILINVNDGCGNYYQLYAMPMNSKNLNISSDDTGITVTLNEDGESERGLILDQTWTVEIRNATTGALMATQSSVSRSTTIATSGWPKGLYVVKATIGKEVLTEKVIVI